MWGDIETELARYVGDGPPISIPYWLQKTQIMHWAGILWVQSRWYTCKLWIFMNFAFSVQHGTIWQMLSFLMAIEVWLSSGLWPRGSTTVLQCEALALPTLEDPHVSGYRSWRDRTTLALDGRKKWRGCWKSITFVLVQLNNHLVRLHQVIWQWPIFSSILKTSKLKSQFGSGNCVSQISQIRCLDVSSLPKNWGCWIWLLDNLL